MPFDGHMGGLLFYLLLVGFNKKPKETNLFVGSPILKQPHMEGAWPHALAKLWAVQPCMRVSSPKRRLLVLGNAVQRTTKGHYNKSTLQDVSFSQNVETSRL